MWTTFRSDASARRSPWLAAASLLTLSLNGCQRAPEKTAANVAPPPSPTRPSATPSAPTPESTPDPRSLEFSEDYFTHNIPVWEQVLGPLEGKPDLSYLEVGVFEGRSAIWMLDNVLTHPGSRLTGIDIFPKDLEQRYTRNLERAGHLQKTVTIKGDSQTRLKRLRPDSFDLIYIDGSHTADDVMTDTVLSWDLLKIGGLLILDDYALAPGLPLELRPQLAIDAFIMAFRHEIEVVHRQYQVVLRKHRHPCPTKKHCSPIGKYLFLWETEELVPQAGGEPVGLSEAEKRLLQDVIRSERFNGMRFAIAEDLIERPGYRELIERLGLNQ